MAEKVLFPSAIDYIREINNNIIDNALGGRSAFVKLPSLYNKAYIVAHETGAVRLRNDLKAPNERLSSREGVNIFSENTRRR